MRGWWWVGWAWKGERRCLTQILPQIEVIDIGAQVPGESQVYQHQLCRQRFLLTTSASWNILGIPIFPGAYFTSDAFSCIFFFKFRYVSFFSVQYLYGWDWNIIFLSKTFWGSVLSTSFFSLCEIASGFTSQRFHWLTRYRKRWIKPR